MEKRKYALLADTLRASILSGAYAHGERLPSENALARACGYSRQTIRQALAVLDAEGLTERVRGSGTYVKSRRVRRGRMRSIAVVSTYISEYIFPTILDGMQRELRERGYAPMLFATENRVDNERRILEDLLQNPTDGLLIEATQSALPNPNLDLYQRLAESGTPVVFFNGHYRELSPSVYVVADDRQAGFDATRYLIQRGHRKIAAIFKADDLQGPERYMGFVSALIAHGLSVPEDHILWFSTRMREATVERFALETIAGCTAAVCYNDEVAAPLLRLLLERGIAVPRDMALVSFDNSALAQNAAVRITSLEHPKQALGQAAAAKLVEMIGGKPQEPAVLPWAFAEGDSV